jgi:fatty acid desaturase
MSDLFDFFKENESKLHEAPPARAWDKIEARLERKRRTRRRGIRFLQLGVVALALLLVTFVAWAVWYFYQK